MIADYSMGSEYHNVFIYYHLTFQLLPVFNHYRYYYIILYDEHVPLLRLQPSKATNFERVKPFYCHKINAYY